MLNLRTGRGRYVEFDEDDDWRYVSTAGVTAPITGDPGGGRMLAFDLEGRLSVFRVDLQRGSARPAMVASRETVDIILDEYGRPAARIDFNDRTNDWQMHWYAGGHPREIMRGSGEASAMPNLIGLLPDGRILTTSGREGGDRNTIVAIEPISGARETLAEDERHDVGGAITDPWSHYIVGAAWTEDLPQRLYFDPAIQTVYDRLQQRFETGYATLQGWSRDRRRFLVFAETQLDAGAYYIYEPATDTLRLVGQLYPEITGLPALGNRQSITYRARDGERVPAYLTLPANVEPSNLPVVLLVHGGPHARDTFTFDWWASFLASRGYAVLQPNYRGSTGYGRAWFEAGRRGWGDGVMQTDVEDGLAALVRSGIADSDRVCIVGASYGGYAALAGATITPDAYDCAIAIAGVSDLMRMLDESARIGGSSNAGAEWWTSSIGDRVDDREHIRAISPANLAQDVRIPILLMHGVNDTVVPIAQSRIMRDRLRQAGKDVRYVELTGDDHWLSLAATRTQMLREIETFLAEHIGAGAR